MSLLYNEDIGASVMAVKKPATTSSSALDLSMSSLPQLEWSKQFVEYAVKCYASLLSFSAKRLQADAEFVQGLADCHDASDLFKRQSEFVQTSWTDYSGEFSKALELPSAVGIAKTGAD